MVQIADYSGGRPTGAALKKNGFDGVIRYVGLGSPGKLLTAAEYRDLVSAGVEVLFVAELGTGDSWGTSTDDDYNRGRVNATTALNHVRNCGVPDDKIFLFGASDAHASAQWQINDTVNYIRGFRDVVGSGRTGHYGFSETQRAVKAANIATGFWRCGSKPSGGDENWVHFWQRNQAPTVRTVSGVICDINDVLHALSFMEDDMSAEAERQIAEMYRSVSRVYAETGRDWVEALIMILKLWPYPVDTKAILARGGHSAGDLVNATHSAWEAINFNVMPEQARQNAKLDLISTGLAALAQNKDITPESLQQMLNEAASKIKITVDVASTPAQETSEEPS
jgi:hypothetical protein